MSWDELEIWERENLRQQLEQFMMLANAVAVGMCGGDELRRYQMKLLQICRRLSS